jgi:type I restriction enzyme M protein
VPTPANVGTALQNAMRCVEAANHKHLYGVFGDAAWTNKDRLPDALLKDLIEHFSSLRLGNRQVMAGCSHPPRSYLSLPWQCPRRCGSAWLGRSK